MLSVLTDVKQRLTQLLSNKKHESVASLPYVLLCDCELDEMIPNTVLNDLF